MSYLLVDLGFYAYRDAAGATEDLDWDNDDNYSTVISTRDACFSFFDRTADLLEKFPGHTVFLARGDKKTFRHDIWPEYKANRKTRRPPPGYGAFIERLIIEAEKLGYLSGGFKNIEDDDVMGLLAEPGDIIVSGDKDMLTVPGQHFRDGELIEVSRWEADLAFYKQALIGDTADNYPGCPQIGKDNKIFKSKDWLSSTTEKELWAVVLGTYLKAGKTVDYAIAQARCARILRNGEFDLQAGVPHMWKPPVT